VFDLFDYIFVLRKGNKRQKNYTQLKIGMFTCLVKKKKKKLLTSELFTFRCTITCENITYILIDHVIFIYIYLDTNLIYWV
jgi:hypothetical protein